MGRHRVTVIAVGLLVILSLVTVVWAQVSTNFDLSWYIFGSGGGQSESANSRVQDTLGQWTGGTSFSAQHQVQAGFWYGVVPTPRPAPQRKVFLPLLLRNYVTYFEGPDEVEPNNTYLQANGPLRSGQNYFGYPNDTNDYFSIYLQTTGLIKIALKDHTGQHVQLQLFYQIADEAHRVAADTAPPFEINHNATVAGWYYIWINTGANYNSATAYTLQATYP